MRKSYEEEYESMCVLMDTYIDEIRPRLERGKFDFIPILDFKAALGNYRSFCRDFGTQVQSAYNVMLNHLETALSGSGRLQGIPESVRARHLAASLDEKAATICNVLDYEMTPPEIVPKKAPEKTMVPVMEEVGSVAAA